MKQAHDWFTEENFLKWLATQPSDRSFRYINNYGCLLCSFANEVSDENHLFNPGEYWSRQSLDSNWEWENPRPIPQFARLILDEVRNLREYFGTITIEMVYLVLEQRREKEAIARIGQKAEQTEDHRLLKMEKGVVWFSRYYQS